MAPKKVNRCKPEVPQGLAFSLRVFVVTLIVSLTPLGGFSATESLNVVSMSLLESFQGWDHGSHGKGKGRW